MEWQDLPVVLDAWVEKTAEPAWAVRQVAANVLTGSQVGYYYDPLRDVVGIFAPLASVSDTARVKAAACRAVGPEHVTPFLTYQDLSSPYATWVKVAYSPTLRQFGETLNFFPGQYPGGIPNSPSPVAAMLTSGLLGAGLGYGGGKLLSSLLPERFGKQLGRTGAIVGGALGAVPGAIWAGTNNLVNKPLNSSELLNYRAGAEPEIVTTGMEGTNLPVEQDAGIPDSETLKDISKRLTTVPHKALKFGEDLQAITLGKMYKIACEKVASTFGMARPTYGSLPTDVNIDALGRTLWDTGASPALAATTMAGMYAAQQLPDQDSRPGWVTGKQLGQLTQQAVGDYGKGYLVGAAVNAALGTPFRNSSFATGNMALGIISAVVPKLFGG